MNTAQSNAAALPPSDKQACWTRNELQSRKQRLSRVTKDTDSSTWPCRLCQNAIP